MVQVRKEDYIYQIKIALKGKIPAERVKYYAKYYEDYITEQVRQGKKTDEVIEELGDPNLIVEFRPRDLATFFYPNLEDPSIWNSCLQPPTREKL